MREKPPDKLDEANRNIMRQAALRHTLPQTAVVYSSRASYCKGLAYAAIRATSLTIRIY